MKILFQRRSSQAKKVNKKTGRKWISSPQVDLMLTHCHTLLNSTDSNSVLLLICFYCSAPKKWHCVTSQEVAGGSLQRLSVNHWAFQFILLPKC